MRRLSCNHLLPVSNVMNQDAADNKHNYHAIYQHIPLGVRTITPQNFWSWSHLGGLALTVTAMIFWSFYKVQTRKLGTLNLNRCAELFYFEFAFFILGSLSFVIQSKGWRYRGKICKETKSKPSKLSFTFKWKWDWMRDRVALAEWHKQNQ